MSTDFNPNPVEIWYNCAVTQERFRFLLTQQANKEYPLPDDVSGDGILYVGGGKFWPGIVIGCRLLRELGCTLPIEVWYRGTCEPIDSSDVDVLEIRLIDADALSDTLNDNRVPTGHANVGGWEAKSYAMTHTKLKRFLYLDADAYCVADPTSHFSLVDNCSMAYWEDLPAQNNSINWGAVAHGVVVNQILPIQGGQIFFNRQYGERALQVMHWMCQNSDFYFRHMFGDQDAWRVAMNVTKSTYHRIDYAEWRHVAFVCSNIIVHRCQGKLFRPSDIPVGQSSYSNYNAALPLEGRVFDYLAELFNKEQKATVFSEHYKRKLWGGEGSGNGSTPEESLPYIHLVNSLAQVAGWKSAVDVGCGDGRVAKELTFSDYTGYDVAKEALELFSKNTKLWAIHLDCYRDRKKLPAADVLLCRDVLHHWPNEWVITWINSIQKLARWKYLVIAQDRNQQHTKQDTWVGGYRALDMNMYPLNQFPFRHVADYLHKSLLILEL